MKRNEPCKHHYVPQFFLRSFAIDDKKKRILTVSKEGSRAVWTERSIKSIGFEEGFYVSYKNGVPVSVEKDINLHMETPISQSETWVKILSGNTEALDNSDRPILYALVRHLESRTPHYQATRNELAQMATNTMSDMPFTDEEREYYTFMNANPEIAKRILNRTLVDPLWSQDDFYNCLITVPFHPALYLPLPGMVPFQLILTVNPTTIVSLTVGRFEGAFLNQTIDEDAAIGFNRHFVGQFAKFDNVRHLISGRDGLIDDMTWAPYDLIEESDQKLIFSRRGSF